MFVFRVEHKRNVCSDPYFGESGDSLTGHGCQMFSRYNCGYLYDHAPRFGGVGNPPNRIMEHERCAVTAEQFDRWVGYDYGTGKRDMCMTDGWHIVAYGLQEDAFGIDWRIDNDQIIFNPEFAVNLGAVTLAEVKEFSRISA